MLDNAIKQQIKGIFAELSAKYTLKIEVHPQHSKRSELVNFLSDVAECSPNIECSISDGDALQFTILKEGEALGIIFKAIPSGHEFTSLILAILNLDGKGKELPDEFITFRIKSLKGKIDLTTYMSLTCTNCPDVVQALNLMAILSDNIMHTAIDGALYQDEVNSLGVQSVPTVYANGELFHVGRGTLADFLAKLEQKFGSDDNSTKAIRNYDVIVCGAGAAGTTAALYLARKGLKIGIVAERIGGQIKETSTIENIPSVLETTGTSLAADLRNHLSKYPTIDILDNRIIEKVELDGAIKTVQIKAGEIMQAPQLIIATGASWRRLGVNGEDDYLGRGVAFCPHCDGPLFEGKQVAVIGGGNSGIEAAIDLSGICKKVTVVEFMDELKADKILQQKLFTLNNVEVFTNMQTMQIIGDGNKVIALEIKDRSSDELQELKLDGVFIQIGLSANSQLFSHQVKTNSLGEIEVDRVGRTSQAMVYASGDVTNVSYKQIIIAMGEGAKTALAVFDDKIRKI